MNSTVGAVSMVAAQEALGLLLQKLSSDDGPACLKELERFLKFEPCWVGPGSYLELLDTVTIAPTQGSVFISNARGVFDARNVSKSFGKNGLEKPGSDTTEVQVQVFAIRRKCSVSDILAHYGQSNVWLQQSQIVEFCQKSNQLRHNRYPILFPCQTGETRFFVKICRAQGRDCGTMVYPVMKLLEENDILYQVDQTYFIVLPQPA